MFGQKIPQKNKKKPAASALSDAISEKIQRSMNLGIRWAVKDPSNPGKEVCILSAAFEGAFEMGQPLTRRSDAIALRMHPSKDASPELGHSL